MKPYNDEPTYAQVNLLCKYFSWHMPTFEARAAVNWLREYATKRDFTYEIKRVKELYDTHCLTKEECFNSDLWEDYDHE